MTVVTLSHSDLPRHQREVFKQLQAFRKEGQLCDLVVKSNSGTEHRVHSAVLCASSMDLKNMFMGPFLEGNNVQKGHPVDMAASDAVVSALLEYVYGEEPQVELEDSLELLRLADAYNLPELAEAIEVALGASLPKAPLATALKVLQQTHGLHELKALCEEKAVLNFESCIELTEFLDLKETQLARILQREDLKVSQEAVVLKGLFKWLNRSKDREVFLGLLLRNVDFQALSANHLAKLRCLSASMGPNGQELQQEVDDALRAHRKRRNAGDADGVFRPKRRCLQHWSPDLGATAAPRKVFEGTNSMCLHEGDIYFSTTDCSVHCWSPGDSDSRVVAGFGATVNGENDLGPNCIVSVSPEGEIFVADPENNRLLSFKDGSGKVVVEGDITSVFCSLNGMVYVLTDDGQAVQKLMGTTLHPVVRSEALPEDLQFEATDIFVSKEEIYICDQLNSRILRMSPHDAEPVVLGEAPDDPDKEVSDLEGLYVTEAGKIYVADCGQQKLWSFHPGDPVWTEVLVSRPIVPTDILVKGSSLYVNSLALDEDEDVCDLDAEGVYEYLEPPEIQFG